MTITKQPVNFATRTFDPNAPPPDMPPLGRGETAACASDFQSNASVGGQTRNTDATHATISVTHVKLNLSLKVTIWVPIDATPHVLDHEEGHRQISEYYYQNADKLAEQIAAKYVGRQADISGGDLNAESNKWLQQLAADINTEYNQQLNPEPTQLLYDDITDHSRNEVLPKDAIAHAIKNVIVEAPQSPRPN